MDEYNGNNPQYPQPGGYQPGGYIDPNKAVMSTKDWIIMLLVFMVPCVNIIMMFVWAFGEGNENRRNYCRANLIITAIWIALIVVLYIIFGAIMFAAFRNLGY